MDEVQRSWALALSRPKWRSTRSALHFCLLLLLGGGWATALAQSATLSVTDDRGQPLRWKAPPQRIVTLLPSLTETVCALGQCHRLVGVDNHSNWPGAVTALPQVGGGLDPSIEAIVALRPDAVLAGTSIRVIERLQALGLKVAAFKTENHADVRRVLSQVGRILDVPQAESARVWRHIDAEVSAAAQSLPSHARGTRVYFEVNRAPYGAGESSFIGETLQRLGARNIIDAAMGPFPKLNPEFVVRANPDVIMVGDRHFSGLSDRPGWSGMRAVREQRLCVFTPAESDVLVRPGPRLAEAARLMAACLSAQAPSAAPRAATGGLP